MDNPDFFDLLVVLSGLNPDLAARPLQGQAEQRLIDAGFTVTHEAAAPYLSRRGVHRAGRVDLLAERNDMRAAVEVDRGSPRRKSVRKLLGMPEGIKRVIVVRDPRAETIQVRGIDRIVLLRRES